MKTKRQSKKYAEIIYLLDFLLTTRPMSLKQKRLSRTMYVISAYLLDCHICFHQTKNNKRDLKLGIPHPLNNIYKYYNYICFFDKRDPEDHFPPKLPFQGNFWKSPWLPFLFSSKKRQRPEICYTHSLNHIYKYLSLLFRRRYPEYALPQKLPCQCNFCISLWLPFMFQAHRSYS